MKKNLITIACALVLGVACLKATKANAQVAGWHNLFDGKTLAGWKHLVGKASYAVQNGQIVGVSAMDTVNSFLVTEKEYGDFVLELDAKIESPLSNSGIQTRSHFNAPRHKGRVYGRQVEIDPSARSWSGGIYDEARRDWIYPLDLNGKAKLLFKTGAYNHIKVECIGNEMKTWINNVPVAYLIDTVDSKGFIGLQVHAPAIKEEEGKKVYFKNIRIKTTGLKPSPFPADIYVVDYNPNYLSAQEKLHGWSLLFDGKTSNGWIGAKTGAFPSKGWKIRNGTIIVEPADGKESTNGGDIVTKAQYSAFDLSFEFKLTPGANSGVKYFVTLADKTSGSAIGLEYQVLDDELHPDAKLGRNGDRKLASLYDLIPAAKQTRFIRPIGQWNNGRVVVYPDNRVEHYLNGVKVLEYTRGSKEFMAACKLSKFIVYPDFGLAKQGRILLQDHGNQVFYRSIKIRKL